MASSGLRGPFRLQTAEVDAAVAIKSPGAYALGRTNAQNQFEIQYIGRSDDDVNDRVKQHVIQPYPQFKFEYYPSATAAYRKECELYHDFLPRDNTIHPAAPKGSGLSCARCGK